MRKFTVTTITSNYATERRIRRPSKDIKEGDLIAFKFSTDTVKAVVRLWDRDNACSICALAGKNNKPVRCIKVKDRNGEDTALCTPGTGPSLVFVPIDDLMEEV